MQVIGTLPDYTKWIFKNKGNEPVMDPKKYEVSVGDLATDIDKIPNTQWICTQVTRYKYYWVKRKFVEDSGAESSKNISVRLLITFPDFDAQKRVIFSYAGIDPIVGVNTTPHNLVFMDMNNGGEVFQPDNVKWDNANLQLIMEFHSYADEIIPTLQWMVKVV